MAIAQHKEDLMAKTTETPKKVYQPPKDAFTKEQLSAVRAHETALGIYDGRYDEKKKGETK